MWNLTKKLEVIYKKSRKLNSKLDCSAQPQGKYAQRFKEFMDGIILDPQLFRDHGIYDTNQLVQYQNQLRGFRQQRITMDGLTIEDESTGQSVDMRSNRGMSRLSLVPGFAEVSKGEESRQT